MIMPRTLWSITQGLLPSLWVNTAVHTNSACFKPVFISESESCLLTKCISEHMKGKVDDVSQAQHSNMYKIYNYINNKQ